MYQGKHSERRGKKRHSGFRTGAMLLATLLLLALAIGGTIAYLTDKAAPVTNTFTPSHVACEVTEEFDGYEKTNVNVTNTGDTDAFIRVRLVSYRTNDEGQHIGGIAELPAFTLGAGWVKHGDYYYYTKPVAPGKTPDTNLTDSMTLTAAYTDADGGHQSIDVMAEAIQSAPEAAVKAAWGTGFSIGADGSLIVPQN